MDQKFQPLYDKMGSMEKSLDNLEQDVHYIKVVQLENNIMPWISTIESCYRICQYKQKQKIK